MARSEPVPSFNYISMPAPHRLPMTGNAQFGLPPGNIA
jgi:hypothetical protein